jgi:hypothetical protein
VSVDENEYQTKEKSVWNGGESGAPEEGWPWMAFWESWAMGHRCRPKRVGQQTEAKGDWYASSDRNREERREILKAHVNEATLMVDDGSDFLVRRGGSFRCRRYI